MTVMSCGKKTEHPRIFRLEGNCILLVYTCPVCSILCRYAGIYPVSLLYSTIVMEILLTY